MRFVSPAPIYPPASKSGMVFIQALLMPGAFLLALLLSCGGDSRQPSGSIPPGTLNGVHRPTEDALENKSLPKSAPEPGANGEDPSEQGISPLAVVSRHIFKRMKNSKTCSFTNPFGARLLYSVALDVIASTVTGMKLDSAQLGVESGEMPLRGDELPSSLETYVACLATELRAEGASATMVPHVPDGTYLAVFAQEGSPGGVLPGFVAERADLETLPADSR